MAQYDTKPAGIKFDATINLGHIITFIGFLVTGFVAWETLDKRVIVLEQTNKVQELRDRNQDTESNSQNSHINETLADIKRSVEKINDRLERNK